MKAFVYIRVSGLGQADGDGPQRQLEAAQKFCIAHALEFDGKFEDAGVSGTVEAMDRPGFVEMLGYIDKRQEPGEPYCIVVERVDRLARDLMISEILLRECRSRGVKVFAADQGTLTDVANDEGDPTRKLLRQILAALSEWERSVIVKKLKIARERVRASTGRCEGRKPYGSTPKEKEIQDWAIMKRGLGENSGWIAEQLNNLDHRTRTGKRWTRFSVNSIITGRNLSVNRKKKAPCVVHSLSTSSDQAPSAQP